jgi:hypothetical protein
MREQKGNPRRDSKGRFLPAKRKRRRNSAVRTAAPKTMSRTQELIGRNNPTAIVREEFGGSERAADELVLWLDNDGDIYRQRYIPIVKNMVRKKAQGKYDRNAAVKGWMYAVDDAAKSYVREVRSEYKWHDLFPKSVRERAARELRDRFERDYADGQWDEYIPKKYRKKKNPPRAKRVTKTPLKRGKGRSPQWWKISTYRSNGRLMGHHIGQGTKRQALEEARKKSEAKGVARAVLRGPFKNKPRTK